MMTEKSVEECGGVRRRSKRVAAYVSGDKKAKKSSPRGMLDILCLLVCVS